VLDSANLETLFEKNIVAIEQLSPDASEREAILEAGLSDGLLIRLPIHERQDGTFGDGKGIFREPKEWSVPEGLRAVVSIVRPRQSQKARELRGQLIRAWSPESQIEVALSCDDPHRLRGEILDALVGLQSPPNGRLLEGLHAKSWLFADGHPVKPQDVLALPPAVDEAARALLLKNGEAPPFLPAAKLAIDVREHRGFDRLGKWVLPDRRSSFEALALMVEDAGIIGRLGTADEFPIDDFATLAKDSGDVGLPGWLLLAAVLASEADRGVAIKVVAAFAEIHSSDANVAGTHLDHLAALAKENGPAQIWLWSTSVSSSEMGEERRLHRPSPRRASLHSRWQSRAGTGRRNTWRFTKLDSSTVGKSSYGRLARSMGGGRQEATPP
jgi:hypothetical protein